MSPHPPPRAFLSQKARQGSCEHAEANSGGDILGSRVCGWLGVVSVVQQILLLVNIPRAPAVIRPVPERTPLSPRCPDSMEMLVGTGVSPPRLSAG